MVRRALAVAMLGVLIVRSGCTRRVDPGVGIEVTGNGSAEVFHDSLLVVLFTGARARTQEQAEAEVSRAVDAAAAALRGAGVGRSDIAIGRSGSSTPQRSGERLAGRKVTVRIRELDRAGDLVARALAALAPLRCSWELYMEASDPEPLLHDARKAAMQEARERADELAAIAGARIGQPLSIREETRPPSRVSIDRPPCTLDGARSLTALVRPRAPNPESLVSLQVRFEILRIRGVAVKQPTN
jgi:hypothetical protein